MSLQNVKIQGYPVRKVETATQNFFLQKVGQCLQQHILKRSHDSISLYSSNMHFSEQLQEIIFAMSSFQAKNKQKTRSDNVFLQSALY